MTVVTLPESDTEEVLTQSRGMYESAPAPDARRMTNRVVVSDGDGPQAATHYFHREEVDVPAEPVSKPPLVYPERAYMSGLSGKVRVRLFINETGDVDEIEVVEIVPYHPPFADAAVSALKGTAFSPAMIRGRTVKSQRLMEVVFNAQEDRLP